jgi:RimJ/RimL family protein N-acetyltransferase
MIDDILSLICNNEYNLYKFSLVCSDDALTARLQKDIDDGIRENNDIIDRALSRLPNFYNMDTIKIDVSDITPEQAADTIYRHIYHGNIFLETERLYLRKYTIDDVEKNYLYSQEESRKTGIPNEVYADMQASRENVEFILSTYEKGGFPYVYIVALKDTDEYIGHASLSEIPEGIEIGYAICEKHQGKGFATEIVTAYAAWGKRELGLEKIYGVIYPDNTASKKVLEKAGFIFAKNDMERNYSIYVV